MHEQQVSDAQSAQCPRQRCAAVMFTFINVSFVRPLFATINAIQLFGLSLFSHFYLWQYSVCSVHSLRILLPNAVQFSGERRAIMKIIINFLLLFVWKMVVESAIGSKDKNVHFEGIAVQSGKFEK